MNRKYNNIDELFRDKFDDFEVDPPDYVWENVKSRIVTEKGNGRSLMNKGGIAGLSILLIVSAFFTFFYLQTNQLISEESVDGKDHQATEDQTSLLAANFPVNTAAVAETPTEKAEPETAANIAGNDTKTVKKRRATKVNGSNSRKNSTVLIEPVFSATPEPTRVARKPITAKSMNGVPELKVQENLLPGTIEEKGSTTVFKDNGNDKVTNGITPEEPDMMRGEAGDDVTTKGLRSDYGAMGRWHFGLYFTPEIISYPSGDHLKNYSQSLDLNASYSFGSYFLQSGIGVSRVHDQGNSMIDYNKYLGSYEDVYNVTFDSTDNGVVPVYYTETVNVYDSISHVVITPTKRYFTYLQVPLFLGYGKEMKRFGWFVKGGPSVSFLVHEKIPSSNMDERTARIVNIENELPGRIHTNWQFVFSAGATYKIGARLNVSMEPMFRYYLKSAYQRDDMITGNPFSIGLRTGLILGF